MNLFIAAGVVTILGLCLLRKWVRGEDILVDRNVSIKGKVVIVTGSNSGIGKETVRDLAKRGATVYMACRSLERGNQARDEIVKETKNENMHCRKCDLGDFVSIRQFVKEFKSEHSRLDILINNGGVFNTPKMYTKQGLELQFGTNHVGHFLLTELLIDLLKKSAPSRVVVVSSYSHTYGKINFDDLQSEKSYDPNGAYGQSKLANLLFARQLAKKLQGTGVVVNALHPGVVATEISRHLPFVEHSIIGTYFVKPLIKFVFKSPYQGALTSIYVALHPSLEKVTGKYFCDCAEKKVAPQAEDWEVAERLWTTTEQLIKDSS